jgi:hypothetical protein
LLRRLCWRLEVELRARRDDRRGHSGEGRWCSFWLISESELLSRGGQVHLFVYYE